jgi:IclR family transcriptional regulator, KDG regulon repressor
MNNGIKSTVKSLRLLRLFSPQKKEWSIQDLVAGLGYHKSSIQRIVSTLEAEGFLKRVQPNRMIYRLGPQILFLGSIADMSTDLRSVARPIMERLVERIQETSYLCVLDGDQCLYIEKAECSQPIRIIHAVGRRNPLHCTGVGKALLSGMTAKEIKTILAEKRLKSYTPHTITRLDRLLREIEQIRNEGVAYDHEELDPGVKCIAAPIRNHTGKVVAAISISGPRQRFTAEATPDFEKEIKTSARMISGELGFFDPGWEETRQKWEARGLSGRKREYGGAAKNRRQRRSPSAAIADRPRSRRLRKR